MTMKPGHETNHETGHETACRLSRLQHEAMKPADREMQLTALGQQSSLDYETGHETAMKPP